MSVIITIRCYRVCIGDAGTMLLLIDKYPDSYNNNCAFALFLSGNKCDRIVTLTLCAECSQQFPVDYFFIILT